MFTGLDKPDPADPTDTDPFNVYRFNNKRIDPASGDYDMGFRDYSPGLNRLLTRDSYNGALDDMGLTTSPYIGNRYAYGAGNPISGIELDGHDYCDLNACDRDLISGPASAQAGKSSDGSRPPIFNHGHVTTAYLDDNAYLLDVKLPDSHPQNVAALADTVDRYWDYLEGNDPAKMIYGACIIDDSFGCSSEFMAELQDISDRTSIADCGGWCSFANDLSLAFAFAAGGEFGYGEVALTEEFGLGLSRTANARSLGRIGEFEAGIDPSVPKTRIPSATGTAKYRVPDALTDTTLTEVKNTGTLSRASQIRDFAEYARANGLRFDLIVRQDTRALFKTCDCGLVRK